MASVGALPTPIVSGEDLLRADLYGFIAALLSAPPNAQTLAQTAGLTGDETEIGAAIIALSRVANGRSPGAVRREYDALFIGLGRGELLPHASFYLTGFLNEKPLAKLRDDMARLGVARADGVSEPEDHIASLCETMAGMIRGTFGDPTPLTEQKRFFEAHLSPWAAHFFADLEGAESSVFYAPVGTIGRAFVEIEREAFRME
jgi:TorA maturation chaperone TorD